MSSGRRVTTRQISSGGNRRTTEQMGAFRRSVDGRRVVEQRDRPVPLDCDDGVADRRGRHDPRGLVRGFMKDRAVQPDDVPVIGVVVLDLGDVVVVMEAGAVRREVAVGDGLFVVSWAGSWMCCGASADANVRKGATTTAEAAHATSRVTG